MKNKIVVLTNKYASLLLAIILLASSLVIPMAINAEPSDEQAKAEAVAALRTAWKDLESVHRGTEFMQANSILTGGTWLAHPKTTAGKDTVEAGVLKEPSTTADEDLFGTKVTTLDTDSTDVKSSVGTNSITVYYGADVAYPHTNPTLSKNIFKNKTVAQGGFSDAIGFYVYIRVSNLTAGKSLKVKCGHNWDATTGTEKEVTISANGLYRLTDKDFYNGGFTDFGSGITANGNFSHLRLIFSETNSAKIEMGSMHWQPAATTQAPSNIDTMSVNELITAAEGVNTAAAHYMASKVSVFRTALNTVKNLYTDDAELFALVNAYKKLENERKGIEFMQANSILTGSTWLAHPKPTAGKDTVEAGVLKEPSTTADEDLFGTKVTTLDTDSTDVKSSVGTNSITVYYGADVEYPHTNPTLSKNIFKNKTVAQGGFSDATGFYVYIRVSNLTAGKSLKVKCGHNWDATTGTEKEVTITANGLYRLTDKDFYNGGFTDFGSGITAGGNFSNLRLIFSDTNSAKIEMGSMHWASAKAANIPDDIDGLSAEELYDLVASADLSDASYMPANITAFSAALAAFEISHNDLLLVSQLKKAWSSMTLEPTSIMAPSQKINTGVSPAIKVKEGMFVSTNTLSANEQSKLGDNYATVDTDVFDRIDLTKDASSDWSKTVNITEYSDILLNIYVEDITKADYIKVDIQNSAAATGVQINIPVDKKGQWITLSARDIFGKSFADIKSATSTLKCFIINTDKANGDAVLKVGSLMGVTTVTLPAESVNWDINDWLTHAVNLDISNYKNTDDFTAALRKLKNAYPQEAFVAEVQKAWTDMTLDPTSIMATAQKIDTKVSPAVKSGDNVFLSTADLSAEEQAKLGAFYATVYTGIYNRIDLTKNKSYNWESVSITDYSDILLNIYVESITKADYIKIDAHNSGAAQSGPQIDIPVEKAGQWITLSARDIFGRAFEDVKKDINDLKCFIINTDKTNGNAVLKIGSLMGVPGVKLPEGSESWSFNKWISETIKLDTSNYNNTAAFEACRIKALNYKASDNIMSCEKQNHSADSLDLNTLGTNVLKGIKPTVTFVNSTANVEIANKRYPNLTDGDFGTSYEMPDAVYTADSYVDIVYQVSGKAKITKLLVAAKDLAGIDEYEIYVGDKRNGLFTLANREVIYKKTGTDDAQVQLFTYPLKSEAWGTYIGFRIKNPTADASAEKYVRLVEIGAYGVVQKGGVEASNNFTSDSIQKIGNNILSEKKLTPMFKFNGNTISIGGLTVSRLYDNDMSTLCRLTNGSSQQWKTDDGSVYLDVYFDLGRLYKLDKFFISHFNQAWDTNKILTTGEFEIYASEDFATLFQGTSRVASYNNRSDEKGDGSGTTTAQLFTMYGDGVVARYVSFRIVMPVSNWAEATEKQSGNRVAMISELGVYGIEYDKPVYDTNLTSHVPLTVYRSDASGLVPVSEDEFGRDDYRILLDGETDAAAPIATNGKTLEYLYNLCGSMDISVFRVTTLSPQIKGLKIYASLVKDQIWDESALIYSYTDSNGESAVVEKLFTDTLKKARYVRFSVTDINGDTFNPVEIEVIGKDNQISSYRNIVQDQDNFVNLYLVDKASGDYSVFSQNANKLCTIMRPIKNMIDGDSKSLLDLYAGKNNEKTINIMFALDSIASIDEITLTAGSNSKYWPSKLNYYFGTNEEEVLTSKTPAKSFTTKPEGGAYSYAFLPKEIQYVRVEIAESDNPYFTDKIISVISEISVKGLTVKGIANDESVASFTDSETGIKLDILKNTDNDVFDRVQAIKVTKRDVLSSEKDSVSNSFGISFSSPVYTIELLDIFGKTVNDVGGREIVVRFPIDGFEDEDNVYLLQLADGAWKMLDAYPEDGYLVVTLDSPLNLCFALSEYKDDAKLEDDSEINLDDSFNDDFGDDFEELDNDLNVEISKQPTSSLKKKLLRTTQGSWVPYIIGIIAAVVVIGAGGTFIIIFIKKRKKKQ